MQKKKEKQYKVNERRGGDVNIYYKKREREREEKEKKRAENAD